MFPSSSQLGGSRLSAPPCPPPAMGKGWKDEAGKAIPLSPLVKCGAGLVAEAGGQEVARLSEKTMSIQL